MYKVNIQQFEHYMVSIRCRWHGKHGVCLTDTPPQMLGLTTDSLQRNVTVIIPGGHPF